MARILALLVCANLLICTLAIKPTSTVHTLSPTPTPTTPPATTEPVTTEPSAVIENGTFTLYDKDDVVCLMMTANMTVTYTYKNASSLNKTVSQSDPVNNSVTIVTDNNRSNCNRDNAMLTLRWIPGGGSQGADPRYITFNFSASYKQGHRHWTFDKVGLQIIFSKLDFPDYKDDSAKVLLFKGSGFFNDEVEFERGYRCDASQEYQLQNFTNYQIDASITVSNFHVQAFIFKTPGEFGNTRRCLSDSGDGNKIVPIAVGIALAVLVVAVIIAFVISKLVNRKKSSYEALN